MGFVGFNSGLQDKVNAWRLPERIVRDFNLRLVHDVAGMTLTDLQIVDKGMIYPLSIEDCENAGTYYVFTLRICRNDMDFWIADLTGYAYDKDYRLIWAAKTT